MSKQSKIRPQILGNFLVLVVLAMPVSIAATASCPNLARNLSFGSRGADVIQLQNFLTAQGDLSAGNNTGYFGRFTEAAVKKFQCKNNIACSGSSSTTGWGSVGPKTRKVMAVCPATNNIPTTSPVTIVTPPPTQIVVPPVTPQPPVSSCIPLPPQTQTLACPSGQTGSITQTRISSCPGPTWIGWQSISNICTAPIVQPPPPQNSCPSGWICPSTPILSPSTKIGAWYELYWNAAGTPGGNSWVTYETRYRPLLGYYGSGDASVITTHFAQMKAAGIDYVVLDDTNFIGGAAGAIDTNAKAILNTDVQLSADKRMPLTFVIGAQLWMNHDVSAHQAEADYVYNFAQSYSSIYFQWNGKPLLVVYNDLQSANPFGTSWTDSRFTVRHAAGEVDSALPWTQQYAQEGLWGWVIHYPQVISGTTETIAVMPGWDSNHVSGRNTTPIDREQGMYYMREWLNAIKHAPANIVIPSWNEWGEETSIEPATAVTGPAWKDYYGVETPDWYLQITGAYAHLRMGLMTGVYYRDEDDPAVYLVENGRLVYQGLLPHGHPVIFLPAGTLKGIRAAQ